MSGPGPLFAPRAELLDPVDRRPAGHVLHRGRGPEARHVNVRGLAADGRVLAIPCSSTGRPLPGAALEVLDPAEWPPLRGLLDRWRRAGS